MLKLILPERPSKVETHPDPHGCLEWGLCQVLIVRQGLQDGAQDRMWWLRELGETYPAAPYLMIR